MQTTPEGEHNPLEPFADPANSSAGEQVIPVRSGDYLFDPETGEVLDVIHPDAPIGEGASTSGFEVTDTASAEWVLEKMQREDAEIHALNARLLALETNMQTMIADHQRRRAFLEFRFGPELEHFAKENMPKGKKTWTCPYGVVGFRSIAPKLAVRDEERALNAAKVRWPDAVKTTEKFLLSGIPDESRRMLLDDPVAADIAGLEVVPGGDKATISTGVK